MITFDDWRIAGAGPVIQQYDNLSRTLLVAGDIPDGYDWDLLVQAGGNLNIIRLTAMDGGVVEQLAQGTALDGTVTMASRRMSGSAWGDWLQQSTVVMSMADDMDSLDTPGIYALQNPGITNGPPDSLPVFVIAVTAMASMKAQLCFTVNVSSMVPGMYTRYTTSSSWSDWYSIL